MHGVALAPLEWHKCQCKVPEKKSIGKSMAKGPFGCGNAIS
jgi:hypothetical protein